MLDVSYVRFVTKVSAWNRTIYAAFAAFNLLHNGARRTTGIYLYLFLQTATLKAHWGSSRSEGRGEPERPPLPGGLEGKD